MPEGGGVKKPNVASPTKAATNAASSSATPATSETSNENNSNLKTSNTNSSHQSKHSKAINTSLFNPTGVKTLLVFASLACVYITGFMSRLFSVIRYESIIHEFDPWFNYRATHYMVENGYYNFLNWFDERAWYPLGRIVGGTVYPGLML